MVYLYRNKTNFVQLPYFENIDIEGCEIKLNDGCFDYPISFDDLIKCNNSIEVQITIPFIDTKNYFLVLTKNDEFLKQYKIVVQEQKNSTVTGELVQPLPLFEIGLPTVWLSEEQNGASWTVNYTDKIRNSNIELGEVKDSEGNDLSDYIEGVTIVRETQIIDIEFNENVTGYLELLSNEQPTE